mmetsp:Transcript_2402/g.3770  ORF Transcript_2402/g.3770 Transcript_2402/m.3770 type:complete len:83 (-) Transcript_2402:207-455(-)
MTIGNCKDKFDTTFGTSQVRFILANLATRRPASAMHSFIIALSLLAKTVLIGLCEEIPNNDATTSQYPTAVSDRGITLHTLI